MIKRILVIILCFFLYGCGGERCIEADDFGHAIFSVNARMYPHEKGSQKGTNQVAPWRDSSYRVNGRPLMIVIKGWRNGLDDNNPGEVSAWSPWFGTVEDFNKLSDFAARFPECRFIDNEMCCDDKDARIMNAPCLFKNGVGLYALIADKDKDPNRSFSSKKNPEGINFHLGTKQSDYYLYEIDKLGNTRQVGGRLFKFSEQEKTKYNDSPLYFKIFDRFYDDNSGQYRIVVKSGITRTDPDPISYVTRLVKEFLFGTSDDYGIIRNIYKGIVNNSGYRMTVSALLTLYIMYTAMLYLTGNIEITQTELIVRVSKFAVVSALLSSQYSWTFFNDYLFVYFIGGVEQILQIIAEAGATGPGAPGILSLMIAPQTISKLLSLLFVDWQGFIYILLFFIALYFIIFIYFEAAVLYLTALIAVGMIITMGPIFICFMLFDATRSLFDNWLKQLTSYAVQPIILFTGLVFISLILRQEIYGALGFRVCKHDFPLMTESSSENGSIFSDESKNDQGYSLGRSLFYWWFPQPMKGEQFTRETRDIPIPMDHYADESITGSANNGFCEAYGCIGKRYIDLPFLDPEKDTRRLNQFWSGKFVQLDGLLIIFIAIYLLNLFNSTAVSVARFITDSSGNFTDLNNVTSRVSGNTIGRMDQYIRSMPGKALSGARRLATRGIDKVIGTETRQAITQKLSQFTPGALIDKARIHSLKNEAMSSKANKAVIAEVSKLTGIDRNSIKAGSMKSYEAALGEKISKYANPNLLPGQRAKLMKNTANALSKKSFEDVKKELAKLKYGKEYSNLNEKEKAIIDNDHKSLRELATNAAMERKYRNAYVDAYASLSDKGVGLFGKRITALRSLQELNKEVKDKKEIKEAKKQQRGEEIVSAVEGLKSKAYKALISKDDDAVSRNIFGGAWHEIDQNPDSQNNRKQTYDEMLKNNREKLDNYEVTSKISQLNNQYKTNVTSPEFLAKANLNADPNLPEIRDIQRKALKNHVQEYLASSDDPALLGEKFMRENATNDDMKHAIDRAHELKNNLIENDEFIQRREDYQNMLETGRDKISKAYEELKSHYGDDKEVNADNMGQLLEEMYKDLGVELNKEEAKANVEDLKETIEKDNNIRMVIEEIDVREQIIEEEVSGQVNKINEFRKASKLEDYKPEIEKKTLRNNRKIDDYLKNK